MQKSDERISDIRSRYDKVISDLQQEKMDFRDDANNIRTSLSTKIESINKQIDEMEKKFDRLLMVIDKIQEKLTELRIKDIARGNE